MTKKNIPQELIDKVVKGELSATRAAEQADVHRHTIVARVKEVKPDWVPTASHCNLSLTGWMNCTTRVCPICGQHFHVPATKPHKMLCSRDCEIIHAKNRARLAAQKVPEHTCEWCGAMVEEGVDYCSVRCAEAAALAAKGGARPEPTKVPPCSEGVHYRIINGRVHRIINRGTCGGGTIRRYC